MSGEEAFIEHIESNEIKKLIDLLYSAKPEDVLECEPQVIHQDDVIQQIDTFLLKVKNR
jgi:hypothetical protein